jgi:arginine exporter protein ArgO
MHTDHRTRDLTLIYALAIGVLVPVSRLVPYLLPAGGYLLWNLVPIGALALFVGSRLRDRSAFLVPLAVMLISDLVLVYPLARLGHSAFSWATPFIYASLAVYVLIGRLISQREISPMVIGGAALLASLQFFVISNFAVWLTATIYPRNLSGLLQCYVAGVPFYRNTLAGDLFFSGMIFAVHALLLKRVGSPARLQGATSGRSLSLQDEVQA